MKADGRFIRVGGGSLGAKAGVLARFAGLLEAKIAPAFSPAMTIDIPPLAVIATDVFDRFMDENRLEVLRSGALPDRDVAAACASATLPASLLTGLDPFVAECDTPLAVRSSSVLEDAVARPFAGVYATRMLANSHPDPDIRRAELVSAIKYIYASAFFRRARDYFGAAGRPGADHRMGVVVQELVGTRGRGRFYPHVSGVAQSLNFYPFGLARPEDGVVSLALGLGKTIVDDGVAWSYSPACPHANPPYTSPRALLRMSQRDFWAVDLSAGGTGRTAEADALRKYDLLDAEQDGALRFVASTYLADDDRIVSGVSRPGPRIVDFAPLLKADLVPLTRLISELLGMGSDVLGAPVEIEFALTLEDDPRPTARFGFLQIRPMAAGYSPVEVHVDELNSPVAIATSESALGNGQVDSIRDVVYVRPGPLDPNETKAIARELQTLNRTLTLARRPYLLLGLGRWGSSDPSAGIPVDFAQISGATVIVESTLPDTDAMLSQGSHFFHNITSFRVLYLAVSDVGRERVDWAWLEAQPAVKEAGRVRHVWLPSPLRVKVDGRTRRGVVLR